MVSPGRAPEPIMVGPYRLIQRLGEGGMGVVHLALDGDGKAVAIKVLRPHIAADPDARRRLEREVATLRRVQHPRVAAVIDADVEGELPYLVTSFVPGKPLDTYVREHGPLPRGHVARVGSVLASALTAIHAAGVVHRDVKPANVMMLDGEPILIDFGIAHVADESRITHTGLVMGTPGYLSPEIIGGEPVTPATDWWGWGATLAFAATGRAPFGTGPIEVVLDRVRRGLSDLEGMDEGLKHTLTRALSVHPDSRPAPEVLVSGLAAVPPVRPKAASVIDLEGSTGRAQAAPSPYPIRPEDRTVPRTPGSSGQEVTMVVPPPEAAGMRAGSDDPTDPVPPPESYRSAQAWGPMPAPVSTQAPDPEPAYAGWATSSGTTRFASAPSGSAPSGSAPSGSAPSGSALSGSAPSGTAPPGSAPMAPAGATELHRYADRPAVQPDQDRSGQTGALKQPVDPAVAGRGVLIGVLLVLCLIAAVAPQSAICIVWAVLAVSRVVDHSNTALLRRQQFGARSSDAVMVGLAVPWRVVVSALSSLFLLVLPVLIGISVTFIVAAALAGGPDRSIPSGPGSLAIGMGAILLTSWVGPGGGSVRRGARIMLRKAVRGRRSQLVAWSVIVLFVIAALMVISQQGSPDWGTWEGTWLVRQLSR